MLALRGNLTIDLGLLYRTAITVFAMTVFAMTVFAMTVFAITQPA
jgi:hypothetical protein